jgi:hypothetical protein
MKTENNVFDHPRIKKRISEVRNTHFQIINSYLDGKGLPFQDYNYSKADITDFAMFTMRYIREEAAQGIIACILSMVHQYDQP